MQLRNFLQILLIGAMLTACAAETPETAESQDDQAALEGEPAVLLVVEMEVENPHQLRDSLLTVV